MRARPFVPSPVSVPVPVPGSSLALVLVLQLLFAASCAAPPDAAASATATDHEKRPRLILPAKLYLAPIADATGGDLDPASALELRAEILYPLLEDQRSRERRKRPALALVAREKDATAVLEVTVRRFSDGSRALWLLAGLGAGRPGFEVDLALRTSTGEPLRATTRAREGYGFFEDPLGPRRAMVRRMAAAAVRFVRAARG